MGTARDHRHICVSIDGTVHLSQSSYHPKKSELTGRQEIFARDLSLVRTFVYAGIALAGC